MHHTTILYFDVTPLLSISQLTSSSITLFLSRPQCHWVFNSTSHPIPSHRLLSNPIQSHPIPPIPSHPIPSQPIPFHHIISHHIPSHHIPHSRIHNPYPPPPVKLRIHHIIYTIPTNDPPINGHIDDERRVPDLGGTPGYICKSQLYLKNRIMFKIIHYYSGIRFASIYLKISLNLFLKNLYHFL